MPLSALLCFFLLTACTANKPVEDGIQRITRPMMGTLVEVAWRTKQEATEADVVRSALDHMEALASRMSLFDPASELVKVNAAAGKAPVRVSDELLDVIEKALSVSRMTGGAFDATVGSVEAVWGDIQREGGGRLPGQEAVQEALGRVGYQRVGIDRGRKTVFLEKEGMRLDLGGIAKGYIVDQGMAWLKRGGIQAALINAGGDIRAMGGTGSRPWRVGLQDPFTVGRVFGTFPLQEGAVVTSGSYERYFEAAGKKFTHIMDPATGRPVEGLVSVTVIADETFLSDALATAVMVEGRQGGITLLDRLPGVRGVFVEKDGTIWVDEDLKDALNLGTLPPRFTVRFYGAPTSSVLFFPQAFVSLPPGSQRWAWMVQGRNPALSQNLSASRLLT